MSKQTNYTIGEGMELPSKGKIYTPNINAHVELRSMTARDEMKRLSPSTTQFKVLADIIEGCMIEKPGQHHVYDMALGDYEYLLHRLRIITYGDSYKMGLRCPYCGKDIETIAHLEELHLKEFDLEKFEAARTITLPKSGRTIGLKFQTPRMLDEIEAKVKDMRRKYKSAEINFELLCLLLCVIDTVDGQRLDEFKLENFINNLPALDMTKIVNCIDELNALVGIDNKLAVSCPYCGGEVHTTFRFGSEFFRPTTI
jgi:DNA-directed RNA polymerase subunit RPC12/RpoP